MPSDDDSDATNVIPTQEIADRMASTFQSIVDGALKSVNKTVPPSTVVLNQKELCVSIRAIPSQTLSLDIHVDSANKTATFKIRAYIFLQQKGNNRTPMYLFVNPENIQTLDFVEDGKTELRFTLKQPPQLVVPRALPVRVKHKSKALLQALKSFATDTTEFCVHILSDLPASERERLYQACRSVSLGDFRTDRNHANLPSLFAGKGGVVALIGRPDAGETAPPPYEETTASDNSGILRTAAKRRRAASIEKTTFIRAGDLSSVDKGMIDQVKHRIEAAIQPVVEQTIRQFTERIAQVVQKTVEEFVERKDDGHLSKRVATLEKKYADLERRTDLAEDVVSSLEEGQRKLEADLIDVEELFQGDIYKTEKKVDDLDGEINVRIRNLIPEVLEEGSLAWRR